MWFEICHVICRMPRGIRQCVFEFLILSLKRTLISIHGFMLNVLLSFANGNSNTRNWSFCFTNIFIDFMKEDGNVVCLFAQYLILLHMN